MLFKKSPLVPVKQVIKTPFHMAKHYCLYKSHRNDRYGSPTWEPDILLPKCNIPLSVKNGSVPLL